MSAGDDALREMAANRGCRLVKSRIRTPGRGDHGHYGLKEAKTGREVMGFGKKGLTATREEVEAFLRVGASAGWKSSLRAVPAKRGAGTQAAKSSPKSKPKPAPEPCLAIREARPADAEAIADLIASLGYKVAPEEVRVRLRALRKAGLPTLVAMRGKEVVGCVTLDMMTVLHRPKPVGRISMLVVAEQRRGQGDGAALVTAAEAWLKAKGCGLVEVTSNRKRTRAHRFYEQRGYERTSFRFVKML